MNEIISFYHHYFNLKDSNLLISYKGPFSPNTIDEIGSEIERNLATEAKTRKKIFNIFIELAQNIHFYSCDIAQVGEKQLKIGLIALYMDKDHYYLTTGNIVDQRSSEFIWDNCKHINSLDREQLRRLKFDNRDQNNRSHNSKGGGIGLIHIALASAKPLRVDMARIDDDTFFYSLTATVAKEEKQKLSHQK